jgi:hypothetical protein
LTVKARLAWVTGSLLLVVRITSSGEPTDITPPPGSLNLDPFYRKYVSAEGLPVVGSATVPDAALRAAADIVNHMLRNRPDVRAELVKARVRVAVMAKAEVTTDIPEHRDLSPKAHWGKRARGLGATRERLAVSCAEENLLGYADDRYRGESILIHEFAHTVHLLGLNTLDKGFNDRLKAVHERGVGNGLWVKTYAATDPKEYWAEGVQSWFDANLTVDPPNGIHNHVGTRAALERYDPDLAELIADAFRREPWRWPRAGAHKP